MVDSSHGHVKPGICCFSVKHAAFERKSKDGLARNQHVSKWSDKYIYRLLREDYKDPAKPVGLVQNIQLSPLVYYKTDIISSNATCYRLKISHFALNNNSL